MKIAKETLEKIAHFAQLEIDPGQEKQLLNDLNEILVWVEQLKEVNTEGVRPLIHMSGEINVLRDDVVGRHLNSEEALKQAPERADNFFKVPQFGVKKNNS